MVITATQGFRTRPAGCWAARDGSVEKVYTMKNAKPGPDYYEMDPEEQFRVMKDIRDSGLEMIGLFHSHPTGQAYPSQCRCAAGLLAGYGTAQLSRCRLCYRFSHGPGQTR